MPLITITNYSFESLFVCLGIFYNLIMKSKSLAKTNHYLKNQPDLRKAFIRNIASSTAVETGQSVEELVEEMTKQLESKPSKQP